MNAKVKEKDQDENNEQCLPNFIGVFEQKLDRTKKRINKELGKPKDERDKSLLKNLFREKKSTKKAIKKAKKGNAATCPHCGKEI